MQNCWQFLSPKGKRRSEVAAFNLHCDPQRQVLLLSSCYKKERWGPWCEGTRPSSPWLVTKKRFQSSEHTAGLPWKNSSSSMNKSPEEKGCIVESDEIKNRLHVRWRQINGCYGSELTITIYEAALSWWLSKESALNAGDPGLIPGSGKCPGVKEWQPTPVFWPGEFHGQSSLAGYSLWGRKESDTTERHTHIMRLLLGEQKCSIMIVVVITLLNILVKIHWIVYIKLVNWWTEHMNLFTNRIESPWLPEDWRGVRINWEIAIDIYTLLYIK